MEEIIKFLTTQPVPFIISVIALVVSIICFVMSDPYK